MLLSGLRSISSIGLILCCTLVYSQPEDAVFRIVVEEVSASDSSEFWTDELYISEGKLWIGYTQRAGFSNATYSIYAETMDHLTTYYITATAFHSNGETLLWILAITEQFIEGEASRSGTGTVYLISGELKQNEE